MFIGGLITVSLLALVVQLVDVNQRDASRSETQRDMQAAMNYMTQELREAVFVYDGDCLRGSATVTAANYTTECPGVVNHIPLGLSTASGGNTPTPILAFWRPDPLPQALLTACNTNAKAGDWSTSTPAAVQNVPCLSGRTYTLVVYVLVDDTNSNDTWQGRGRIVRYQLPQFTSSATTGADTNTGYVDPLSAPNATFQQWPFQLTTDASNVSTVNNAQTAAGGRPTGGNLDAVIATGNAAVLVDYVDDGLLSVTPSCAANGKITPKTSTVRSFYACVRGNTYQAATSEQQVNQEVQVFLVGNVQGRPGFPVTTALPTGAIESQAFPMQTRVLTRGIINKSPK